MDNQLKKVAEFHSTFQYKGTSDGEFPQLIGSEMSHLRYNLMKEENEEYIEACEKNDIVEIADALGDQLYILCGTILRHGMQDIITKVFEEIHRSNMSKLDENGQPIFREDGKILKGSLYSRPNIKPILDEHIRNT